MFKILKADEKALPQIASLLIKTMQECYGSFLPASFLEHLQYEKQLLRHKKYFKNNTNYYIVKNDNDVLMAFTSYGKNRNPNIDCPLELYTLYVDKNYQGQGYGSMLLHQVLANMNHENRLAVSVFEANPYISFYKKHGFYKHSHEVLELEGFELNVVNMLLHGKNYEL